MAVTATPSSAAPEPDARTAIQSLLDRRAEAFLARDRKAFLETIDKSSTRFAARQQRLFDNTDGISFADYDLVADWSRYGDLVRPSDVSRYADADTVSIPLTEERYRIKGFDE